MELICVKRVDLSERVKCRIDLQAIAFILAQQSKKLIVLRSQLKDDTDADDDVLKVSIIEGFTLPLVLLILTFPELAREFCRPILPASTDAHALVELDTHFGEATLPDVVLLELFLDARTQSLRGHLEKVLHTSLWVGWVDLLITPDAVKAILGVVHEGANLAKVEIFKLGQLGRYLLEMAVDYLCLFQELLILLICHVFALNLLPAFDLVKRANDAAELILFEICLLK
mgnify:CR=1 FL=1